MSTFQNIAKLITASEAERLAAGFNTGQPISQLINIVNIDLRKEIRPYLEEIKNKKSKDEASDFFLALSLMGKKYISEIDIVWSGPKSPGAEGRTTWGVASELVNSAVEEVYAATYSASNQSPYLKSMVKALERGVLITCLVDPQRQPESANVIKKLLPSARLLRMKNFEKDDWSSMHSKFVVVDYQKILITSANFSKVAADTSLETGILLNNSSLALQMKKHVDQLLENGILEIWN
jgi:phosphatidylserine/phosphatidylglycerophosphate/cardiolipin synthase-like enzyme